MTGARSRTGHMTASETMVHVTWGILDQTPVLDITETIHATIMNTGTEIRRGNLMIDPPVRLKLVVGTLGGGI